MRNEIETQKNSEALGTQDLEAGMRPSRARDFAVVAAITVVFLLVFNSEGLVRWTQRLPWSETSLWVATRAYEWNLLMRRIGTASVMENLRPLMRRYTPEA